MLIRWHGNVLNIAILETFEGTCLRDELTVKKCLEMRSVVTGVYLVAIMRII